ncbi:MAG: hypothetical protein WBM24_01595 [Candidatus Sulfotelmatobacter sp.]
MRDLFLPKIAGMGGEGVIESLAIDILGIVGEMNRTEMGKSMFA